MMNYLPFVTNWVTASTLAVVLAAMFFGRRKTSGGVTTTKDPLPIVGEILIPRKIHFLILNSDTCHTMASLTWSVSDEAIINMRIHIPTTSFSPIAANERVHHRDSNESIIPRTELAAHCDDDNDDFKIQMSPFPHLHHLFHHLIPHSLPLDYLLLVSIH